jgi:hypothetical protein
VDDDIKGDDKEINMIDLNDEGKDDGDANVVD